MYDGVGGVRDHIIKLKHYFNKENEMKVELSEKFLKWLILESLPTSFDAQSRLRRVLWNPWQSNGKLRNMKNRSFEVLCHKQIRNARSKRCPDRASAPHVILRNPDGVAPDSLAAGHFTSEFRPPTFHIRISCADILHPDISQGWERRTFQLLRIDIFGPSITLTRIVFLSISDVAVFS
ncbi:hypothetical protein AAG906_020110 [Vitis piasezkii]